MSSHSDHSPLDQSELDNFGVDWVVHYEFEDLEISEAIEEFQSLIHDLSEAQLQVQVRHGHGASLLICIRVPRDHLGNMVFKSRVKDWLYGIDHELPVGDENTIIDAETPAESLRSVYHAVTWQKSLGGAGITPKLGKWKNISTAFPLHDPASNAELLRKWSRTILLTAEDLDAIRALFGEKVAFYFAFIQSYSSFLAFPATCGVLCWYYLGSFSITFAVANSLWSIVFIEYWKIRETDLGLRWRVKGVGALKVTRPQYFWDKEVQDSVTGEVVRVFSAHKQFLRQLLLIPFASVAALALGSLIVVTFALEVFISEVYTGQFKEYLEFLPTVLFSLSLPSINGMLTRIATRLTDFENYRTQDQYDLAQTSKTFVMNFITSFLPTILTAFVYVPFASRIVPYLNIARARGLSIDVTQVMQIDGTRLQQEVIYLSMTGQVLSFGEEVVLPYVKRLLWNKWRDYQMQRAAPKQGNYSSVVKHSIMIDAPEESSFLARIRDESEADEYDVHEDILEMCVQFGYLALFGSAWPLVALGFLVNNWLELRGDFFKLSRECQRPPPIRTDSIGPSLQGLEVLSWLGTLSTAAIIYLYRDGMAEVDLSSLLLAILCAEWAYLGLRFAVGMGLRRILSGPLRREAAKRYAVRKTYLQASSGGSPQRGKLRVRFRERVSVYTMDPPSPSTEDFLQESEEEDGLEYEKKFWSVPQSEAVEVGIQLIEALGRSSRQPDKKGQ